jgi:hypothetical protein
MNVIPDGKLEQIVFSEQHYPVWEGSFAAIGLSSQTVLAIKNATSQARASYDAAGAARQASKGATTQSNNDIGSMRELVAEAVKAIRLFAETTDNPNVYAKAEIPPPAPPTPARPPTQPVEMRAVIDPTGSLTLNWKVGPVPAGQNLDASTSGVLYLIKRRLAGQATFTFVGAAEPARSGVRGVSSFTDEQLPAGSNNVQYTVQGRRSVGGGGTGGLLGPESAVFTVMIGTGAGGGLAVTGMSEGNGPMKMAA